MAFLILIKRGLLPFPEFFGFFQLGKVQNFTASFSSSELSAHRMAPGGVIAHQRGRRALQLIRAECSSNGSWRSHSALAESSRTPAHMMSDRQPRCRRVSLRSAGYDCANNATVRVLKDGDQEPTIRGRGRLGPRAGNPKRNRP